MARKKARSAKQKANDKRLGRMAKARAKNTIKKASKTARKTIKRVKRKVSVAKKGKSGGLGSSKLINKIPILKNKTVQRIGFGLGMGRLASMGARAVPVPIIQQNAPLIGTAVAFATEPLAGIVDLALSGGLGQIGNLLGSNNAVGGGGGGAGFA